MLLGCVIKCEKNEIPFNVDSLEGGRSMIFNKKNSFWNAVSAWAIDYTVHVVFACRHMSG